MRCWNCFNALSRLLLQGLHEHEMRCITAGPAPKWDLLRTSILLKFLQSLKNCIVDKNLENFPVQN
jgi:hypothetical protein